MKTFSPALKAAIAKGEYVKHGAVYIAASPAPLAIWGGVGELTIGGVPFVGVSHRALVTVSGGALGASAQNIDLKLSGVDPAVVDLTKAVSLKDAPAVLYRLYFNRTGSDLLDLHVYARGTLDQLPIEAEVGGLAEVTATLETAARGLGKRGARMRSDADQVATFPEDRGLQAVSFAGKKTLYWGGQRPDTAESALPDTMWTRLARRGMQEAGY